MILDDIEELLRGMVVFRGDHEYTACVLWVAHAHSISSFDFTPRLGIWSPEKGCGKSLAMEILSFLVPNPIMSSSITASALFRVIEKRGESTVLFIDESDATFGRFGDKEKAEAIRQILNSGFKRGLNALRCEGRSFEVKEFKTFCPIAIAGIGTKAIPDTVKDRAITIEMRRKLPSEAIRSFESDEVEELFSPSKRTLAQWVADHSQEFRPSRPPMPSELSSRGRDVWKPLFKIAESAGLEWQEKVRKASLALQNMNSEPEEMTSNKRLLSDIRDVFNGNEMTSHHLIQALKEIEEAPYAFADKFNPNTLSRSLSQYGIKPKQLNANVRGYRRVSFEEAWARYLDPLEPVTDVIPVTEEMNFSSNFVRNIWTGAL
jgi:hypothetical protein